VAREESISAAAESLHLSQPTLSRQLKDMEDELGKQLLIRGNRKVTLTEEGMILRKRAEEILDLVKKTETEISVTEDAVAGDVYIGAGEANAVHFVTQAARRMQNEFPNVRYHISSGDCVDVCEQLDKGLIDFGVVFGRYGASKYNSIELPPRDRWGVLMRKDSPLAQLNSICPQDLWNQPLIVSRQAQCGSQLEEWLQKEVSELHIAATYNLLFNASLMVEDGMGVALCLENIINTACNSALCFRPLTPELDAFMSVIWKKYQVFSKPAEKFLLELQNTEL
jgi:DNA-binding transcriptional LysR family regulator